VAPVCALQGERLPFKRLEAAHRLCEYYEKEWKVKGVWGE